jgi:hypothetical protein
MGKTDQSDLFVWPFVGLIRFASFDDSVKMLVAPAPRR